LFVGLKTPLGVKEVGNGSKSLRSGIAGASSSKNLPPFFVLNIKSLSAHLKSYALFVYLESSWLLVGLALYSWTGINFPYLS
jgi:hypothetical protein